MDNMSTSDKAIKKSADENVPFESRPSAKRLPEGQLKDQILAAIPAEKLRLGWDTVHVIDYPGFDKRFDFYRVNFYYTNQEDPTTSIDSWCVSVTDIKD